MATTAKQLIKLDAAMCLLEPRDLATTYLEAVLDDKNKEVLLAKAFGKKLGDEGGAKRDRTGSVLAKYAHSSDIAPDEDNEDDVMADADDAEVSDSDDEA